MDSAAACGKVMQIDARPRLLLCTQRLEVKVFQGPDSEAKTVMVRVDVTQKQSKRYQGGYKDKRSGALYHHADSQTDKQVRPLSLIFQTSRRNAGKHQPLASTLPYTALPHASPFTSCMHACINVFNRSSTLLKCLRSKCERWPDCGGSGISGGIAGQPALPQACFRVKSTPRQCCNHVSHAFEPSLCVCVRQASGEARAQRFERECQTVATRQSGGQTHREAHVQMARPDLLLDTSRDRFLSPRTALGSLHPA